MTMRYRKYLGVLLVGLTIAGCDSTTQPSADAASISFSTDTSSTLLPGLLALTVTVSRPAAKATCYTFTGLVATEAGITGKCFAATSSSSIATIVFPIARLVGGVKNVDLRAELSEAKAGPDGVIQPDHSAILAARDTSITVAPQPLAPGLRLIDYPGDLYGATMAYSSKYNSIVFGEGGGIGLIDLTSATYKQVYPKSSFTFFSALSPSEDSTVVADGWAFQYTHLIVRPLTFVSEARTSTYPGLVEPFPATGAAFVTSNGKAFMPMQCGVPGCAQNSIAEYDFKSNQWRMRADAGAFSTLPKMAASGDRTRIVVVGKAGALDCCVVYNAVTDAFVSVSSGIPAYPAEFTAPLMLNFDGSVMLFQNRTFDASFKQRGDFSRWHLSGLFSPVLAPESYVAFSAPRGVVLADVLTGQPVRGLNLGFRPTILQVQSNHDCSCALYVAPDASRTLVAIGKDKIALVPLRN